MSKTTFADKLFSRKVMRGIIAITIFVAIWEIGARSEQLFGLLAIQAIGRVGT